MRVAGEPNDDLKFRAAVVVMQLRARNTGVASCAETDDGVADGITSVYRHTLQAAPSPVERSTNAVAWGTG
ncbi:hypothetical protein ASG52_17620 [Methylobacterium sp. Leaf456]|nr:hypothetical protein ASG52_17620 [Methylobacterium sp. Leaf456]